MTNPEILQARSYRHFRVTPRTPVIGGWIEDFHLAALNEEVAEDLRDALWYYGVLFARAQHLGFAQLKAVAQVFGDRLEEHSYAPTMAEQGHPEVVVIRKLQSEKSKTTTDIWHHDVSARKHPNIMSILQADQVPFGADTMWASMTSAYLRLPQALKQLFLGIEIDHDTLYLMMRHDFGDATMSPEKIAALGESATHPAVIAHHATGRPCLFVGNGYVKRVNGFTTELSELVLKIANEMPKIPELQVRHQWEPGDVAIWDNFATAHYGVSADIGDQLRLLYRAAAWSERVVPTAYAPQGGPA